MGRQTRHRQRKPLLQGFLSRKTACSSLSPGGGGALGYYYFLYPVLENASEMDTRSKSGASKSRPRWAAHIRIGNVWEYPPPREFKTQDPKNHFCLLLTLRSNKGLGVGLPSHPRPPHRALCFAVFYCTVVSRSKIETIRKKACLLTCLKSYLYSH